MVEVQNFNQSYTHKVRQETIKQILFDVDAKNSSGSVVNISDLSRCTIDLTLRSDIHSNLSTTIYSGNFADLVTAMYCQSTMYTVTLTQRPDGYKIAIQFDDYPIETTENVYLEIKTNFQQSAFSSLVLAQSSVSVETIPSEIPNFHNLVPVIDTFFVGNNANRFEENIGSDVVGVIAVIDNTNDYSMTPNAKVQSCELTSYGGYNKSVSENVLLAENIQMLGIVESYVMLKNLVLYRNVNAPLDDAKLKIAYQSTTTTAHRVLVVRLVQPFA